MNVYLTGGSGFLGRQILHFLKKDKHEVFCPSSKEINLEKNLNIEYLKSKYPVLNEIDVIIHSAVFYGGLGTNLKYPFDLIYRNNCMTNNIYNLAIKLNIKKFISVGSACAWPGHLQGDLLESDVFNGRPHDSIEAYGFNKRVHLIFNNAIFKQFNIKSNQLALANLYGEHDVFDEERSHVISALIKKVVDHKLYGNDILAWGTGKAIRQFLYVKDAAEIIAKSVEFEHNLYPINVYGHEISIKDLVRIICNKVGVNHEIVKWESSISDGVPRKVLAIGELDKLLKYNFTNFDKGLERTINWYISNKKTADSRK